MTRLLKRRNQVEATHQSKKNASTTRRAVRQKRLLLFLVALGSGLWICNNNNNNNNTNAIFYLPSSVKTILLPMSKTSPPPERQQQKKQHHHHHHGRHRRVILYHTDPTLRHSENSVYACRVGRSFHRMPNRFPLEAMEINRLPLPPQLSQLLEATYPRQSKNTFFLGDSIAWQFHNIWIDATEGERLLVHTITENGGISIAREQQQQQQSASSSSSLLSKSNNDNNTMIILSSISNATTNVDDSDTNEENVVGGRGGYDIDDVGLSAYWRNNGYFSEESRVVVSPVNNETTTTKFFNRDWNWNQADVQALLDYQPYNNNNNKTIGAFDAVIWRIPFGWLTLDQIQPKLILKSIATIAKTFGVSSVIITTPHFSNNILTIQQWYTLKEKRGMFQTLVDNWQPNLETYGPFLQHVVLLDWGGYTDRILLANAVAIGYDDDSSTNNNKSGISSVPVMQQRPFEEYTLDRLEKRCYTWAPSIVMACGQKVVLEQPNNKTSSCQCPRNMLSVDGQHYCMNQVGARFVAAMACILSCLYNKDNNDNDNGNGNNHNNRNSTQKDANQCSKQCNQQLLEMNPF